MQKASAGQRESPSTPRKRIEISVPAITALSPDARTNSLSIGTVGPVGVWLGWASFWAFGYAGYLFPLLLAGYGASAFIRSRMVTGWPAAVGFGILLLGVTGILTRFDMLQFIAGGQ